MNVPHGRGRNPLPLLFAHPHSHENWEIIYHLSGDTVETVGDQTFHLIDGTVTVIPAGLMHEKTSQEGFFDMYLQARHLCFTPKAFTVPDSGGNIRILMEMAVKTLLRRENSYEEITDGLFEVICLEIRKNMQSGPSYAFVNALKDAIYDNVSNAYFDLSEEICRYGFHPDHVRRRFREVTGMTPLAYLTALRINKAKMMLVDSSFISIADVSEKCGFRDSFYFSTCFSKSEGISPIRFRMQNKE